MECKAESVESQMKWLENIDSESQRMSLSEAGRGQCPQWQEALGHKSGTGRQCRTHPPCVYNP